MSMFPAFFNDKLCDCEIGHFRGLICVYATSFNPVRLLEAKFRASWRLSLTHTCNLEESVSPCGI